jgi:hypothetical protein
MILECDFLVFFSFYDFDIEFYDKIWRSDDYGSAIAIPVSRDY